MNRKVDLFDSTYSHFEAEVLARICRKTFGEDFGQNSWTTAEEFRSSLSTAMVWLFKFWGTADLLYASYQGLFGVGVAPGALGAAFFIPTGVVPLLLITHGIIFRLLMRSP